MKRQVFFSAALAASLLGTGCISFNVGDPVIHEMPADEVSFAADRIPANLAAKPSGLMDYSVSVAPVLQGSRAEENVRAERNPGRRGWYFSSASVSPGELEVSLQARVSGTFSMEREVPVYRVVIQKKASFGFVPAAAEFDAEDDALHPFAGGRYEWSLIEPVLWCPFATLRALVWEPFDWRDRAFECHTHAFREEPDPIWNHGLNPLLSAGNREWGFDAAGEYRFRAASAVPGLYLPKRADMPAGSSCVFGMDNQFHRKTMRMPKFGYGLMHDALFGFHKYREIRVETGGAPRKDSCPDKAFGGAVGPSVAFSGNVELSIPSMNWRQSRRAVSGKAVFSLPKVPPGEETAEGVLRFSPASGDIGGMAEPSPSLHLSGLVYSCTARESDGILGKTKDALADCVSREHKVRLWLPQGPARAQAKQETVVVTEIHHWHETPSGGNTNRTYDVTTEKDYAEGRMIVRVDIRDESKTVADVDAAFRPFLERNVRDAFLAENPGVEAGSVRVLASASFAGRSIRYVATAYSVDPSVEGFSYDAGTRTGTIRLRFAPGSDRRAFKDFVRDNIGEIVRDKNIVLETDGHLPDGAEFVVGDSNYDETGLLVVEFEVVK